MPPQSKSPITSRVKSPPAVSSCNVCQEMFVNGTHQIHFCARIHDHGQMFGLIVMRTQEFFYEPHIKQTWRESRVSLLGQTQKIHLETRHLLKSPLELPRFPSSHCCSQGLTDQVVPLQMVTKPELKSTQLAQKRKNYLDTILPNVADS